MTDKHTPRPWQIVDSVFVCTSKNAPTAEGTLASHNDRWHVADCACAESLTRIGEKTLAALDYSEQVANARLIAQAPAMLSVLRELLALPAHKPYLRLPHWRLAQEIVDAATKETP